MALKDKLENIRKLATKQRAYFNETIAAEASFPDDIEAMGGGIDDMLSRLIRPVEADDINAARALLLSPQWREGEFSPEHLPGLQSFSLYLPSVPSEGTLAALSQIVAAYQLDADPTRKVRDYVVTDFERDDAQFVLHLPVFARSALEEMQQHLRTEIIEKPQPEVDDPDIGNLGRAL